MIQVTVNISVEHIDRIQAGGQIRVLTRNFDGPDLGGPDTMAEQTVQLTVPAMDQKYVDVQKAVAGAIEIAVAEHRAKVRQVIEQDEARKAGRVQMGMFSEEIDDDGHPLHRRGPVVDDDDFEPGLN